MFERAGNGVADSDRPEPHRQANAERPESKSEQPNMTLTADTMNSMSVMPDIPRLDIAFLLAQLGHYAAERYTARIAELELTPPQAGILRAIAGEPGRSQQALSEQLGLLPSRVVAFIDDLERRGLLQRRRNPGDRRLYALYLTEQGEALMTDLAALSDAHELEITEGLSEEQRSQLGHLLATLAERQQPHSPHPAYSSTSRARH